MNSERRTRNSEKEIQNAEQGTRNSERGTRKDDLKRRTFDFSVRVMRLAESLPETRSGRTIANQIVRSGTSVGANYRAAKRAKSNKDFISKMGTVEEECDETIYWIELGIASGCVAAEKVASLLQEANELLAITVASIRTAKARKEEK